MKSTKLLSSVMLLSGILGVGSFPLWLGGVFPKVPVSHSSNSCYVEFPAIREETLNWDHPILKDWSEGDIISFFGSCSYDPLGKEEIRRQRAELRRYLSEVTDGDCDIFEEDCM